MYLSEEVPNCGHDPGDIPKLALPDRQRSPSELPKRRDLALIATSSPIDAAELRLAIDRTFGNRGLQAVPLALPQPPADWRVPFRRMATEVGVDEDLDTGHQVASLLLDPVLDGSTPTGGWDPMTKRWTT